ncbi:hypothetical protein [Spongiactinospora sp. 9N601]|uniref:hypothetical protein n=1 Tax=Spongiactinospora sp. 9N601 TaxID=3375149 RepID=UPI00378AC36E
MLTNTLSHYINLLHQTWIQEAFAWIVIISDKKPMEHHEVATLLSGGAPPEIWDDTPRMILENTSSIGNFVAVRSGSRISLIEPGTTSANSKEILEWLSVDRRVWSISWHIKGGESLKCMQNGEILFGLGEYFDTDYPFGTDIAAAQHELHTIGHASLPNRKAAALAVMESLGGFRLTREWLDTPQPVIMVDQPIPPNTKPPSAFASVEPELAGHLERVSSATRRSFFFRLIEQLIDIHDLRIPQIMSIFDHIRNNTHPSHYEWHELVTEVIQLSQNRWYGDPADASAEWLRWQAAIAIQHALRSLDGGGRNVESLLSVRNALHNEWEGLREEVLTLPT